MDTKTIITVNYNQWIDGNWETKTLPVEISEDSQVVTVDMSDLSDYLTYNDKELHQYIEQNMGGEFYELPLDTDGEYSEIPASIGKHLWANQASEHMAEEMNLEYVDYFKEGYPYFGEHIIEQIDEQFNLVPKKVEYVGEFIGFKAKMFLDLHEEVNNAGGIHKWKLVYFPEAVIPEEVTRNSMLSMKGQEVESEEEGETIVNPLDFDDLEGMFDDNDF